MPNVPSLRDSLTLATPIQIIVKANLGTTLNHVLNEAIAVAVQHDVEVVVKFNDMIYIVDPFAIRDAIHATSESVDD